MRFGSLAWLAVGVLGLVTAVACVGDGPEDLGAGSSSSSGGSTSGGSSAGGSSSGSSGEPGSSSSSGGEVDAGDAGLPPPVPCRDDEVFCDDFETGTLMKWDSVLEGNTATASVVALGGAYDNVLRVTSGAADQNDVVGGVQKELSGLLKPFRVEVSMRIDVVAEGEGRLGSEGFFAVRINDQAVATVGVRDEVRGQPAVSRAINVYLTTSEPVIDVGQNNWFTLRYDCTDAGERLEVVTAEQTVVRVLPTSRIGQLNRLMVGLTRGGNPATWDVKYDNVRVTQL